MTTHKQGLAGNVPIGAGVRVNKIGFDGNLCSRQSASNEFISGEIRQSYVHVYPLGPSSDKTMNRQHGGHGSSGRSTSAITGMANSRPGNAFPHARLAGLSAPKKSCRGTHEAIVVERLHYGNPGRSARGISRWGDQRKSVVEVRHVWLLVKSKVLDLH